ncbi:MAG TPA: VOC family protein [Roseiflexaceae bacterium]|nr:VOC family protein [Roseiflexaceae bacterium]
MTSHTAPPQHESIHPDTRIGLIGLQVADLDRSLQFYTDVLGFIEIERADRSAVLGPVDARPLLVLRELKGARPKPREATGLYHFAVLLPSRADLGRAVQRLQEFNHPIREFEDHLVSESAYLADPDGNGIELYRDRPRAEWPRKDGRVTMGSEPIDVPQLLADGASDGRAWAGLPAGTRIGHLHLQVADIPQADAFYRGILGFDLIVNMKTALFVSAGGYHHHLGMNVWFSQAGPLPPPDAAGLLAATIEFADDRARAEVVDRLATAGVATSLQGDAIAVHDAWGNTLLLVVGAPGSAADALGLFSAASPGHAASE